MLGCFNVVKDAQDDGNITIKKKLKMPKDTGKNVACCHNHFAIDFPLKGKLAALEEGQVQQSLKA